MFYIKKGNKLLTLAFNYNIISRDRNGKKMYLSHLIVIAIGKKPNKLID